VVDVVEPKHTKRKLDGISVPTYVGGPYSRVGAGTELVPLDRIPDDYPALLPTLIEYSALDAVAALVLYGLFKAKLEEMPWTTPMVQHSTNSGIAHVE
jgi:hypothetical protein